MATDVDSTGAWIEAGLYDPASLTATELLHFSPVVDTSLRRIADAAGEMFILDIEGTLVSGAAADILALARQSYEAILMTQAAIVVFEPMFRTQLEQSIQTSRMARIADPHSTTPSLAVGIVDPPGFTSRSEVLSTEALLDLVLTVETNACDQHLGTVNRASR